MPPEHDSASEGAVRLVIVTGSGRSGTSTVAGSLKKLGVYVPQPEIDANEANPRGYFEPKWAVEFHKRFLEAADVKTNDGRPVAWEKVLATVAGKPRFRAELREWLPTQLQGSQIVVKDPRTFWARDLWVDVATELGVTTEWLTMLRHPCEVAGSRDMHYLKSADAERRRTRETANIAGWVNIGLFNEKASRGTQRVFTRYTDLISDWRTTMAEVARRLDLTFDHDLAGGDKHEIDDFIDAGLRRSQLTWDDLDVPASLREVAEGVWQGLDALADDPQDATAMADLDRLREDYDRLYAHSSALVSDETTANVAAVRKQVRRKVTRELQDRAAAAGDASLPRRIARKIRSARAER